MLKILRAFSLFIWLSLLSLSGQAASKGDENLLDMNVEELLNVTVTSAAKKAQSLNDAAAAIFVISSEDIKRAGVTTIPDALRLAPGLDVSRIDSNKWAVTSRGFNGRFANKLLVLIDGRNTYTRAFAGVYWEMQDVMLEDVDRIEIIRGPGGALWGANAVNGVINIITKHSGKTQGGLLAAGGGTEEKGFGAFRYGGKLDEKTTGRAYVKGFWKDDNSFLNGAAAGDNWDKVQGGFRADSQLSAKNELTVQGDMYHANLHQTQLLPQLSAPYSSAYQDTAEAHGGNILTRWQHTISPTSEYSLQAYYDYYHRNEIWIEEGRATLDLGFQYRFDLLDWHDIIWGSGYRYNQDDFLNTPYVQILPTRRNDQLVSGFLQDEMTLIDNTLKLTLSSKFEHNDYSGFEYQPSARLIWAPHHQHRLWTSISRAVRTPSRAEYNGSSLTGVSPPQFIFPATFIPTIASTLSGTETFKTEELIAYELGYRTSKVDSISLDLALFYNDYNRIRSTSLDVSTTLSDNILLANTMLTNDLQPKTYGLEAAVVWQMLDWWHWNVNYGLLKTDYNGARPNQIPVSPEQRASLRSALSPSHTVDFDFWFRYVDSSLTVGSFGPQTINAYVTLDLRLAWRPLKELELSLVGQNLFTDKHREYQQESLTLSTAIDRGMYGKLAWGF